VAARPSRTRILRGEIGGLAGALVEALGRLSG